MYSAATLVHKQQGNVTIEQLNDELFPLHVPALVFVVICMITGIVGNLFVIIIYKKKYRRSNHRYFILFLAVTDLVACVTGMPFLVASLRLPYLMTSDIICKSIRCTHYFVNNSSGLLLVVISIERFRKICRPFRTQLSHRHTLYLCWGVVGFSAVMAAPSAVLYSASPIDTGIANLTGYQCYVPDKYAQFFRGYMILLMLETVISITIFAIIYTFIIRALWKNDQFLSSMRSTQKWSGSSRTDHSSSADFDAVDFLSEQDNDKDDTTKATANGNEGLEANGTDKNKNENSSSVSRSQTLYKETNLGNLCIHTDQSLIKEEAEKENINKRHTTPVGKNGNGKIGQVKVQVKRANSDPTLNKINNAPLSPVGRLAYTNVLAKARQKKADRPGKNSRATARVTVMLLTVSVFFAIAFIPHLVLMFIVSLNADFVDKLSETELIFFQIFLRIFIINNVVNPIIYLIFDSKFRMLSKEVFRGKCRKKGSVRSK